MFKVVTQGWVAAKNHKRESLYIYSPFTSPPIRPTISAELRPELCRYHDQRAKFSAAIESNDWDTLTPWFEEVHNNFDPSLDQPQQQQQAWDMETANSYWNTERTLLADVEPQGMEAASELMSEAEEAMSSGYQIHAEVLGAAAMFSAGQFESLASAMNQVMVKHGAAGVQAYHELFGE